MRVRRRDSSRVGTLGRTDVKVSEMTKWLVQIDYLTSSGATKHWEGEVEAAEHRVQRRGPEHLARRDPQDAAGQELLDLLRPVGAVAQSAGWVAFEKLAGRQSDDVHVS